MKQKKHAPHHFQVEKATGTIKLKYLFIGLLAGIAFIALVVALLNFRQKSALVHATEDYHPATYAVGEKFMCGCSKCDMELVECDCSETSGGLYELYSISERLKEDASEAEVIREVSDKFGRIKGVYWSLAAGDSEKTEEAMP